MSVNGLGNISTERASTTKSSVPLELQSDCIHNVHVQGDEQTGGALVPAETEHQLHAM